MGWSSATGWNTQNWSRAASGGGGFTPTSTESSNFLTRATGITSDTDKTRYDALITGLVTNSPNLFAKLDALYIFAAPTRATAVLNLISSSYAATEHGTPTSWTANVGYTGDGSTFYLDTGINACPGGATWGGQYQQDSASTGVYVLNNGVAGFPYAFGVSNNSELKMQEFSGSWYWKINDNTGSNVSHGGNTIGQWIITRTGPTASAFYKNGNTTSIDSPSVSSVALPRNNIMIFSNDAGAAPSALQMSATFIGSKLTNTEASALAGRINTFMTAYGINVY